MSPESRSRWPRMHAAAHHGRAADAILLVDGAGIIRYGNRRAQELVTGPQAVGSPLARWLDPFSQPKLHRLLEVVRREGSALGYELALAPEAATPFAVVAATAVRSRGGVLLLMRNTAQALTLARRLIDTNTEIDLQNQVLEGLVAERTRELVEINRTLEARVLARTRELETQKQRFEAILQSSADGVIALDARGCITSLNPAMAGLAGLELHEAVGQPLATLWPELELGTVERYDYRELELTSRLTAQRIPVSVSLAPLASMGDEHDGWVLVIRDNTAVKTIERQREDFITTLAHDLKTPVLAGLKATEHLAGGHFGQVTEAQRHVYQAMLDSHRHLLQLINGLLDVYRYEAGKKELSLAPVQVERLVAQCFRELGSLADEGALSLVADVAAEAWLYGDELELKRVLINLVSNAIAHSPRGGRITVRAIPQGDEVLVRVEDEGPGMSAEARAALFGRFVQQRPRAGGTGLGLYLCRQIVLAHGGAIGLLEAPGGGCAFWFRLVANPLEG